MVLCEVTSWDSRKSSPPIHLIILIQTPLVFDFFKRLIAWPIPWEARTNLLVTGRGAPAPCRRRCRGDDERPVREWRSVGNPWTLSATVPFDNKRFRLGRLDEKDNGFSRNWTTSARHQMEYRALGARHKNWSRLPTRKFLALQQKVTRISLPLKKVTNKSCSIKYCYIRCPKHHYFFKL